MRPQATISGETAAERRVFAIGDADIQALRRFLCFEPRGHAPAGRRLRARFSGGDHRRAAVRLIPRSRSTGPRHLGRRRAGSPGSGRGSGRPSRHQWRASIRFRPPAARSTGGQTGGHRAGDVVDPSRTCYSARSLSSSGAVDSAPDPLIRRRRDTYQGRPTGGTGGRLRPGHRRGHRTARTEGGRRASAPGAAGGLGRYR